MEAKGFLTQIGYTYKTSSSEIKVAFDTKYVDSLYDYLHKNYTAINSEKIAYSTNKHFDYNAWDRICTIANRLYDTLHYINEKTYRTEKYGKAFDFYEFLNNAYIIVHCCQTLCEITGLKGLKNEIRTDNSLFCEYEFYKLAQLNLAENDSNKILTDDDCFQFFRSLCAVHPEDITSDSNLLFSKDSKILCCPYVTWNPDDTQELLIYIYKNHDIPKSPEIIRINFHVFLDYIDKWLYVLRVYENQR